jgi:hypothetical protein
MSEQGVLSSDRSCKTFSANANGYARGEAVSAVFIKRLSDAVRDGSETTDYVFKTRSLIYMYFKLLCNEVLTLHSRLNSQFEHSRHAFLVPIYFG